MPSGGVNLKTCCCPGLGNHCDCSAVFGVGHGGEGVDGGGPSTSSNQLTSLYLRLTVSGVEWRVMLTILFP